MSEKDFWIDILTTPPIGYITAFVLFFVAPYILGLKIGKKVKIAKEEE